jgi:hypothetical protein
MPEPTLYHQYTRSAALGLFAGATGASPLWDGQWVVLPECVLGFVEIGTPAAGGPLVSGFTSASRFVWVADRPYPFPSDDPHGRTFFLPPELRRPVPLNDRPIHLCVRRAGDVSYVYVGELGRSYGWGSAGFGYADFPLSPPLASRVWAELGGLRLDELDSTALDADLARLGGATTVQDRLEVLRRLVEYWHGAIAPADGLADEELPAALPLPLRWWYRLAGRRPGLLGGGYLIAPARLRPTENGRVMFLCDSESGSAWLTLPAGDDPPVWASNVGGPLGEIGPLSECLIQACVYAAVTGAPYTGRASRVSEEDMARLSAVVARVPLSSGSWPGDVHFHCAGGAALMACRDDQAAAWRRYAVDVGARSEGPLGMLACALSLRWEWLDWAPPRLDPDWLTDKGVAPWVEAIGAGGRVGDLPILADALEDAGCADAALLDHFRRAPHAGPCRILEAPFAAGRDRIPFLPSE